QVLWLQFDSSDLSVAMTSGNDILQSRASIVGMGSLRLETTVQGALCPPGAVGLYTSTVSPGGSVLRLEPQSDTCAARAAIVTGRRSLRGRADRMATVRPGDRSRTGPSDNG